MIVDFAQEKRELARLLGLTLDDRQSASLSFILVAAFDKGVAYERKRIKDIVRAADTTAIHKQELIAAIERPIR